MDVKTYLKENFFLPFFTDGKPKKSRKEYSNIFAYKGEFAKREREEFFNEAYGEILFDLFLQWVQTGVEEKELREHIYHTTLGLGSVKEKLLAYEMFGKNLAYLEPEEEDEEEDDRS